MVPEARVPHQDKEGGQGIGSRQVAQRADRSHDDVKEGHADRDHTAEGDPYDAGHCPGPSAAPLLPIAVLPALQKSLCCQGRPQRTGAP